MTTEAEPKAQKLREDLREMFGPALNDQQIEPLMDSGFVMRTTG